MTAPVVDPGLPSAVRPHLLFLELLGACDMRCPMCITAPHREDRQPPLRREQVRERLLEPAAALGMTRVALSGGEPTLRTDLPDIVRDAIACGLKVSLSTNLWHTPPTMIREILSLLMTSESIIQFSFDSLVPEEMNRIRGAEVYDQVLATVRSLLAWRNQLQSKARIQSVTIIQADNLNSIQQTVHFLFDTIGVDRAVVGLRHDFANITHDNYRDQQSPPYTRAQDNRQSLLALAFVLHRWARTEPRLLLPGRFHDWAKFLVDPQRIGRRCGAGGFLFVDAYGRLRPCLMGVPGADATLEDLAAACTAPGFRAARKLLDVCRICIHGCN